MVVKRAEPSPAASKRTRVSIFPPQEHRPLRNIPLCPIDANSSSNKNNHNNKDNNDEQTRHHSSDNPQPSSDSPKEPFAHPQPINHKYACFEGDVYEDERVCVDGREDRTKGDCVDQT